MYLLAYRSLGIFYENAVNRMLRDIVATIHPVLGARVTGEFTSAQADWTTSVVWPARKVAPEWQEVRKKVFKQLRIDFLVQLLP